MSDLRRAARPQSAAPSPDERLRKALDQCRAIIKFHVKPEKCVTMSNGDVVSARKAFQDAIEALTATAPSDAMLCGDCGWKGSTAVWRKECKGFPCQLKARDSDAK